MGEKMLKFVKIDQQTPNKRSIDRRKQDFKVNLSQYCLSNIEKTLYL